MRWLTALMLTGCMGDAVGPDQTQLCVATAFETGTQARVMAVIHDDEAPVTLADAPLTDGRGCLTLRAPPPPLLASLSTTPLGQLETPHTVVVRNPVIGSPGIERLPFAGFLIDLAVYQDGDDSGAFEAPDTAGQGPDTLLMRLSASQQARLPFWLSQHELQFSRTSPRFLATAFATLAPGNQPFAITAPTDGPRAWRGADEPHLLPWPAELTLPPTAAGTWCDIGSAWPRCRSVQDEGAFVEARLVDPRIPPEQITRPFAGFDPVVPLPPSDAPMSPQVLARQCADVGDFRVARERTFVPRQEADTCICTVYVRTRWVIALADDPPDWLVCGGRPLSTADGAALAAEAGLGSTTLP